MNTRRAAAARAAPPPSAAQPACLCRCGSCCCTDGNGTKQQQQQPVVSGSIHHTDQQQHPALERLDPSTAFLYAPHTVSALAAGLLLLAWSADVLHWRQPAHAAASACGSSSSSSSSSNGNAAAGVWAAVAVFLGYSVLQGPRTSMARPHPAFWRLVHGAAVVYVVALVWLLFQDAAGARHALTALDPSLGVPVAYRDYGTSCALLAPGGRGVSWAALAGAGLDAFVVAHALGWWAKALLLRNTRLLWVYSVGFELLEASCAHMLPNFNECWWDSWVLDVAICNSLGIYAGMATVRWFECKYTAYNWQGLSELRGLTQRARRSVQQLLPYSWTKLDWRVSSSPAHCLQSLLVVGAFLAVEANVFFLKYALWVPPTNPLNTGRLLLWLQVGAPAVREYYEFCRGASGSQVVAGGYRFHKLGTFAWLAIAMLSLEALVAVKFGAGLYPTPAPRAVVVGWSVAGSVFVVGMAAWQGWLWRQQKMQKQRANGASSRSRSPCAGKQDAAAASCPQPARQRRARQLEAT